MMRAKKVDIQRLQSEDFRLKYHAEVEAKWQVTLTEPITSVEEEWNKIKDVIQNTSKEVIGFKKGIRRREWLTGTTLALMAERRAYKSKRTDHPDAAKTSQLFVQTSQEKCEEGQGTTHSENLSRR